MRVLSSVVLVFLFLATSSARQVADSSSPLLKAAELQNDVLVLRETYETLHPGLYRYNSKTEMDAAFTKLANALNHDQSLQDAYLAFSIFAAKVKCGHTYPNFFNQNKEVAASLFQRANRVPFYFRWIERGMVVTDDFTPGILPRGTEILAINGVPVGEILTRLMTIARADGSNDAKRVSYLEVRGDAQYEPFDIYWPMFFPAQGSKIALRIKRPDAQPEKLEVELLSYEQRIAPIRAREAARKGGDAVIFEWKFVADGTAYLRMPTWALYNSKWDWKKWLNERMDEAVAKKTAALIVDLRGNEGGNDVGNEILARLITSDLHLGALRRLVRYQEVPSNLETYLDTWDASFKNWGAGAVKFDEKLPNLPPVSYFRLTKYDDEAQGDVIHPADKHYAGKLIVLVDASNSSATFQFAQVVQQNKLGTLIGQPTGGNQRGINGGAFFFLRLPNSKIEMDLPLIATFPLTAKPDAGLTPDVVVTPTIGDVTASIDVEMEAARKMVSPQR